MIIAVSKGQQITIPSQMRDHLGINAGSFIEIDEKDGKIIISPLGEDLEKTFTEAKKIKPKKQLTAKDIDDTNEKMFR